MDSQANQNVVLPGARSSSSAVLTDPKVAANSPSMDGGNHSSLPDLEPAWACTSGFSLEHCCPAPPEESDASSHSELESVLGEMCPQTFIFP